MPVSEEVLDEIALTRAEYDLIVERLSREPNPVELGMFGALWSEHCGYKHSKPLLRMFSHTSSRGAGRSRARRTPASVDIGDGLAVVFKVESHNHPSAVEPLPGRGHRRRWHRARHTSPWAQGPSRCSTPCASARWTTPNRNAEPGPVRRAWCAGISWYGNCIGVPDVGGEVVLRSESYSHNPLVNAMCVGLISKDRLASAAASEFRAVCCCWWARTPDATASTARLGWPPGRSRRRRNCGPRCRWATRSWRRC